MVPAAERSHSAGVTSKLTFQKSQRELVSPCPRPYRRGKIHGNFPLGSLSSCGSTPCLLSCRSETPSPLREKWKVRIGPGKEERVLSEVGPRMCAAQSCPEPDLRLQTSFQNSSWVVGLISPGPGFDSQLRGEG